MPIVFELLTLGNPNFNLMDKSSHRVPKEIMNEKYYNAGSKGGDNGQLIQYKSYQRKGMKSSLIQ